MATRREAATYTLRELVTDDLIFDAEGLKEAEEGMVSTPTTVAAPLEWTGKHAALFKSLDLTML
jgi:hypothetical protein